MCNLDLIDFYCQIHWRPLLVTDKKKSELSGQISKSGIINCKVHDFDPGTFSREYQQFFHPQVCFNSAWTQNCTIFPILITVRVPFYPSVCLSVRLSVCVCMSVRPSVCPSDYFLTLCVCVCVCLSVCLSVRHLSALYSFGGSVGTWRGGTEAERIHDPGSTWCTTKTRD